MKNVNRIFLILLFLNLSEVIRVLLFFIDLPSIVTSIGTFVLVLVYVIINMKTFIKLLRYKVFNIWIVLILIIPSISFVINYDRGFLVSADFFYWLSFNALFGLLFIFSAMMAYSVPTKWIFYLVWMCILSTIIGFYVNYANPEFIRRLGELTGSTLASVVYGSEETRNMSFFPHPNAAAFSIVSYFILLFTTYPENVKSIKFYIVLAVLMLAMVSITGSRTSLIISVVILFLYVRPLITKIINVTYKNNSGLIKMLLYSGLLIGASIGVLVLYVMSESTMANGFSKVGSRFSIFSSLFDPSKDLKDESLDERTAIVGVYLKYIGENLLFGYGPVFRDNKISNGEFENVSQNAYLEGAFVYGLFYPVYFFYINFKTYIMSKASVYKNYFVFNSLTVFMMFLFILSFSVNDLFWNRALVIVLGLLIGIYLRRRVNVEQEMQPALQQSAK
jgi:hypothetical protein